MNKTKQEFIEKLRDVISSQDIEVLRERFRKISQSEVYIYGAGNAGRMTYQILKDLDIEIIAFIDRNANGLGNIHDKRVLMPYDSSINKEGVIIISFLCNFEELNLYTNSLKQQGFIDVLYYMDIYHLIINYGKIEQLSQSKLGLHNGIFDGEAALIFDAASCIADELSEDVFLNFLKAVMSSNPNLFSKPCSEVQYFPSDISFSKGYSRFVDCGAFDGDTAIMLKKIKGKAEKIVLYEPDLKNFNKMIMNLYEEPAALEQVAFPCGVWKQTEMLNFNSGNNSTSAISEAGDGYVQCVALDDALLGFAPTMIKMDIEGAEVEALMGAEKIIKKYKPDLAISVYHRLEHMWQIPILIKGFNSNYKFYLRSHGLHGMETVLYAICDE